MENSGNELAVDQGAKWTVRALVRLLLVCLMTIHAVPFDNVSAAEPIDAARSAYAKGHFIDAAKIAETVETTRGFALAAESLTIHAHFIASKGEKEALLQRAAELARRAIRADPNNAVAHLQLARAIGRRAQVVGSLEAANRGYAEQIRDATQTALRLDPDMAAAHLSLGLWHAEIVGAVGGFLADLSYGANSKDAISYLNRALKLAPDAKAVYLECALGVLVLNERQYRDTARKLLKRAIEIPAKDAYDRLIEGRAVERLAALDAVGG